jgi:hypothetical protein
MRQGISVVLAAGVFAGLMAAPANAATKLVATVRPGSITLATVDGRRVQILRSGTYIIVVRDRAARENFHLLLYAPTVGRKTGIAFVGTKLWRITFRPGVYRYFSDAHPATLNGSVKVT